MKVTRNRISTVETALFVLDGVDPSRAAAAAADSLFSSEVSWSILAVVAEHPQFTSGATGFASPVLSPQEMDSLAMADIAAGDAAVAATARAFGSRPVKHLVARGRPVDAVARHVADHPADLVVVDSPSLARELVGDGIVPVLVMPTTEHQTHDGPVLLAVADERLDDAVIATAARLFDPSTTDFVAVHVDSNRLRAQSLPVTTLTPGSAGASVVSLLVDDGAAADRAEHIAENAVADTAIDHAEIIGESGDPASVIVATAQEHDAAMIVVGTHDRGWLARLFRPSVSHAVLQEARRPILVMSASTRPLH